MAFEDGCRLCAVTAKVAVPHGAVLVEIGFGEVHIARDQTTQTWGLGSSYRDPRSRRRAVPGATPLHDGLVLRPSSIARLLGSSPSPNLHLGLTSLP
eukprot:944747-Alexandrium_andersonii.AAC.1